MQATSGKWDDTKVLRNITAKDPEDEKYTSTPTRLQCGAFKNGQSCLQVFHCLTKGRETGRFSGNA